MRCFKIIYYSQLFHSSKLKLPIYLNNKLSTVCYYDRLYIAAGIHQLVLHRGLHEGKIKGLDFLNRAEYFNDRSQ